MSLESLEARRLDARVKAAGAARYTDDLSVPGMLHGVVVRSTHPHARICRIDTARARAIPGVAVVLVAADLPDRRYGAFVSDEPIVARDVVRYLGEPIALVAADRRDRAIHAGGLIEVEYEALEAVVRLEDAITRPDRHLPAARIVRGDAEAVLAGADIVVSTTITSQRAHHAYIEPRAALAEVDWLGRLVVTTTSQIPFGVRVGLAELLGRDSQSVVVRVPALGGGFGGKLHLGVAPHAAVLALATDRPVKVVCSRREELLASNPRENSIVTLRSAVTRGGRIVGREALVYLDSGAYAYDTPALASTAALQSCGPYAIDTIDAMVVPVTTNTAPTGSFRAPTGPQMVYANERHIAEIAKRVGVSDIELRRRNLMRRGSRGPTGQVLGATAADECLDRVASQLDVWRAENGGAYGYGLAMAWWCTMAGASAASITAAADGSLVLRTGATEIGTGAVVSGMVRLVANEIGVRSEDVRLVSADTDRAPFDLGSEGSRTLYGAGSAALRAAQAVRQILAEAVAGHLEADIDDLEFRDRGVMVVGDPTSRVSLEQAVALAEAKQGPVVAVGRFEAPPVPHDSDSITGAGYTVHNEPTFHCHGAQVALDRATGRLVVKRYVAAHDTGTVVNLADVRGQVQGGVIQGLGYALFEEMQLDAEGGVANTDLHDYRIPTVGDVPDELQIVLVDCYPSATGPYGAKGVGEAPILLPAATIAAALRDLVGNEPGVLPLSADRVSDFLAGRPPSYRKEIRGA